MAEEIVERMELSTYTSPADAATAARALRKAMDVATHDDELYVVLEALGSRFDDLRTVDMVDRTGALAEYASKPQSDGTAAGRRHSLSL